MIQKQLTLFILLISTLTQTEPMYKTAYADTTVSSSMRIPVKDDLPKVDDIKEYKRDIIKKQEEQERLALERKEKIKQEQIYLLAQIIHAEAKGEPYKGKIAVGNVVMNRVKSEQFPDTIGEVIFQKGQFSPVSDGSIYNTPGDDSLRAAKEVYNGTKVVGNDVLYFYNPDTSTSGWIYTRQTVMSIGNHRFAM